MIALKDFFKKFWRPILWTVIYIFIMWAILRGLFNFNMFSMRHLTKITHVELHGFAGFVFGVLVLAAVPLYVATTVFTVRNKALPVKIPVPNCLAPVPEKVETKTPEPIVVEQEVLPELPPHVPAEMRESFMRARKNYGVRQMSVFNRGVSVGMTGNEAMPEPIAVADNNSEDLKPNRPSAVGTSSGQGGFPVPDDFDIPVSHDADIPVFSDINFDNDDHKEDTTAPDTSDKTTADLCEYLKSAGIDASIDNGTIFANGFVIAVHDDADFWVADEIDWFAAGKSKPSPIVALTDAWKDKNLRPILYLGNENIMDFETVAEKWRADGIEIVDNRDDLVKLIKE